MTERVKLTEAQRGLLQMIADPVFRLDGLAVCGAREYRTARSLDRRGLARLSVRDHLKITDAGRQALKDQETHNGD